MISFDEFIKQDDEEKYNNMQHDLLEIERLNKMLEEKFMKENTFLVENGIICKKNKEIERLNLIIKYLKKYNREHENYEDNLLIEKLENSNIEWLHNAIKEGI